ncbi:MAG: HD domain-containing phosphohydrolase [Ornithinibacter sp.]
MTSEHLTEVSARASRSITRTTAYVGTVAMIGVLLAVVAIARRGVVIDETFVVLGLLAGLTWWSGAVVVDGTVRLTFSSVVLLAAMALLSPGGAGLIGILLGPIQRGTVPLRARVFNTGMSATLGVLGGTAYHVAGGVPDSSDLVGAHEILNRIGYPILVADLVQVAVNLILLAGVLRMSEGVSMRPQVLRLLRTTGPAYLGYGVVAFLMVVLWQPAGLGPWSAVLVLAPLLVARWAYTQYAEEAKGHERALLVLVAAIEAKAPHLAGHSARVAELSALVAENLGLRGQVVQEARVSGMLHDLGQTSLPTDLVRRRGATAALVDYPARGAALMEDLSFLSGSLQAVARHRDALALELGTVGLPAAVVGLADEFDLLTQVGTAGGQVLEASAALERLRALPVAREDLMRALEGALSRRAGTST